MATSIAGYAYGNPSLARSPVSLEEFEKLKQSVLFSDEDERYLRKAGQILSPQVQQILDLWYGFVGSHEHLIRYFSGPDGKPDGQYLAAVRQRFERWVIDTCERPYDQVWLDYQHEIGLRHHRTKKNQTDGVQSEPLIPLRYILALIYPITATIKDFLRKNNDAEEEVEKMHQAWFKSVVLQVTLWSYPFVKDGDF
ncbi:MAG TPA: protoglobin domain-containing protein [Acidobacteriota bacterium]|nr:protoglobin domain-containing protein [Acidobacteriota bacterium]